MKPVLLLLLFSATAPLFAADLTMFAPAVEFKNVEWLGLNQKRSDYLGEIKRGRVTGSQELNWLGRDYDIQSVERTATGAIEVIFTIGKVTMNRDKDGFFIVDVMTSNSSVEVTRFRTTRKASAHDDEK